MGLADDAVQGIDAPEMPPRCPPFEAALRQVPEWQRQAAEVEFPDLIRPYIERQFTLEILLDEIIAAREYYRNEGTL